MLRFERIKVGLVISLMIGIVYAFTSQLINRLVMADLPYQMKIDSLWLAVFLITALVTIWGVITSIPQKLSSGLILGAGSGALGVAVIQLVLIGETKGFLASLADFLTSFTLALFVFALVGYLLRWAERRLMNDYFKANRLTADRALPILISLLAAAVIGAFSLVPAEARNDLRLVHAYLLEAAKNQKSTEIPQALRDVPGFTMHAKVPYTLAPSTDIDLFTTEAPEGTLQREKGIVIVSFDDNFKMTCLTIDNSLQIVCEKYVAP